MLSIFPANLTRTQVIQRRVIMVLLVIIIAFIGLATWIYLTTPSVIRAPRQDHFHLRLQVIVDGKSEDFSKGKYQTVYTKDVCSASLTSEPLHFHDGEDQFLHVHWSGLTGGLLLKDYGWNLIGGPDGFLGLQLADRKRLVAIHGLVLPPIGRGDKYFVYTGDEKVYRERNWQDFLRQDISNFLARQTVHTHFTNWLIPTANAHGDDPALAKLNDFRGNIVIFAQKDKPTDSQIKARFDDLKPLPTSVCSG